MKRVLVALALALAASAHAGLRDVDFDERPGAALPLNVVLHEGAKPVRLDRFFGAMPVVIQLGYFGCVNLCSTTLVGAAEALSRTGLASGRDYVALFLSIDPRDERDPPPAREGWHILSGAESAAAVARSVGFRYRYEESSGEFAHPAGFVIATPEGKVSAYVTGVRFDPAALRRALLDAARGASPATPLEQFLLVCFHDPLVGAHSEAVLLSLRLGALAFLATMGWLAWRRLR